MEEITNTKPPLEFPKLKSLSSLCSHEFRLAFLSACVIGFITHLYAFSNLLINHDGIVSLRSPNEHLTSGRWALEFFSQFSGLYELPVVIGLLSILALALSAGLTVRVLELTHPVSIVLTAGFLVSFPAVACIFSYLFTADAYFIALLLASLSAYAAKYIYIENRSTNGRTRLLNVLITLFAALCIAASCGIYQAFVGYAIGLLLLDCILRLLERKPVLKVAQTGFRYLFTILLGLILYILILKLLLRLHHTGLTSYRGMDQAFSVDLRTYLMQIPSLYRNFLKYFWSTPYFTAAWVLVLRLLLVITVILGAVLLVSCRRGKDFFLRICLTVAGTALIPAALSFISILTPNTAMSELMRYSYVLLFVFTVKIMELSSRHLLFLRPKQWYLPLFTSFLLCGSLIWNNFCISNTAYLRMHLCYENTYAVANRIAAQIEMADGFTAEMPVAVVGECEISDSLFFPPGMNQLTGTYNSNYLTSYCGGRFMSFFSAFIRTQANEEEKEAVRQSGILDTMPSYPESGSIRSYNGIIVVKLSDDQNFW